MPIYANKNHDNYTVLSNKDVLRNKSLTYRARGLLGYMLSCQEGWKFTVESIANMAPEEGKASVRAAIKELKQKGHLKVEKVMETCSDGKVRPQTVYSVYETSRGIDFTKVK